MPCKEVLKWEHDRNSLSSRTRCKCWGGPRIKCFWQKIEPFYPQNGCWETDNSQSEFVGTQASFMFLFLSFLQNQGGIHKNPHLPHHSLAITVWPSMPTSLKQSLREFCVVCRLSWVAERSLLVKSMRPFSALIALAMAMPNRPKCCQKWQHLLTTVGML